MGQRTRFPFGLGCGYVLVLGAIVIGLLFINGVVVKACIDSPLLASDDLRVKQTLQFGLPLMLIFVEFWVFDLFRR